MERLLKLILSTRSLETRNQNAMAVVRLDTCPRIAERNTKTGRKVENALDVEKLDIFKRIVGSKRSKRIIIWKKRTNRDQSQKD